MSRILPQIYRAGTALPDRLEDQYTSAALILSAIPGIGVGKIIEAIIGGVLSIFEKIVNFFAEELGELIADPFVDTLLHTPLPEDSSGQPALFTKPTNGIWPQIWDLYWGRFFIAALLVGLFMYVLSHFITTFPFIPPSIRQRMDGGYFRLIFALIFAWPFLVIGLYLMDFFIQLVVPEPSRLGFWLGSVITAGLGAVGGGAALTGGVGALLVSLLGLISVSFIILAIALYVGRILYLIFTVAISPILTMGWALRIPFLEGFAKSLYSYWFKLGIAPMFIGAAFMAGTYLMTEPAGTTSTAVSTASAVNSLNTSVANATAANTTVPGTEMVNVSSTASTSGAIQNSEWEFVQWGPAGGGVIINIALGMMVPFLGIGGFVFVLQASMPTSANMAFRSAKSNVPGRDKSVGDLSIPGGSDESINSRITRWDEQRRKSTKASRMTNAKNTETLAIDTMQAEEFEIYRDSNAESATEFYEENIEAGAYGDDVTDVDDLIEERLTDMELDEMDDAGGGTSGLAAPGASFASDDWDEEDWEVVDKLDKDEYEAYQESEYKNPSDFVENELTASATNPSIEAPNNTQEFVAQREDPDISEEGIEHMHEQMAASDDWDETQQEAFEKLNHNERQELAEEFKNVNSKIDSVENYIHEKIDSNDPMYAGIGDIEDFNAERDYREDAEKYREQYEDIQDREETQDWWSNFGDEQAGRNAEWENDRGRDTTVQPTSFKDYLEQKPGVDGQIENDVFNAMDKSQRHDVMRLAADPDSNVQTPSEYVEQETEVESHTEWMKGRDTQASVATAVGRNRAQAAVEDVTIDSVEVDMDDASVDQMRWHQMDEEQQEEYLQDAQARSERGQDVQTVTEFVESQADHGRAENVDDWLESDRHERADFDFETQSGINTEKFQEHLTHEVEAELDSIDVEIMQEMDQRMQQDFGSQYIDPTTPVQTPTEYIRKETNETPEEWLEEYRKEDEVEEEQLR